jgi:predicted AlkP superfamily phosphohydrolase/phosphomutase
MRKVVVIGLDGLEPKVAEPMLDAGELPHLARLREQGGYTRVGTTYPPQTPVAWSTFATGTNPGGHGIFDFLGRDAKTYLPLLSLSRYEQKNVFTLPKVVNLRRGTAVWDLLSETGVRSTVLRCPCTYPPDDIQGQILAGVGVPDLRGGLGTSTFYSSAENVKAEESEKVVRVQANGNGPITTHLIGPRNPKTRSDLEFDITLHVEPSARRVVLRSQGQPKELEIREGEWSDWLKVKFKVGFLQSVSGIVRFYLARLAPEFELYASPTNFDPDAPLFPISSPPEYAGELAAKLGTFYTTGMAEDHDGLNHERFGEDAYLEQCAGVLRERESMMLYELERFREGFFFCLFDTPDRLQHMFWRFREDGHPANNGDVRPEMSRVIEEHYRSCDAIVGRALEYADDQTLFIVLSDHGMSSFQRGLHLNTWLHDNGFLSLQNGVKPGEEAGDFFRGVDWNRTKAYALGLGGIYLNLKGREENGIVEANDADAIKAAIAKGLTGLRDPGRGQLAVRSVVTREQIYTGPYIDEAPDLLVNFSEGYRVSWGTPLGGVPEGLFEDNIKKWGGDHVIDPELAPGVLFMNRPFRGENVRMVDLAPTILAAFGMPKGPAMEGGSLLK